MWILFLSSYENCSGFTSFLVCRILILPNSLFWSSTDPITVSNQEEMLSSRTRFLPTFLRGREISCSGMWWISLFVQVHLFQTDCRLLYRPSFLWRQLPDNLPAQNHTIRLHWCNNSNSNPLVCSSRKSNQYAALFVQSHFNLCEIVLGSFVSYRGVIVVATMGSTAPKKHVCRRVLVQWGLQYEWASHHTLIPRDRCNQTIREE